ncbi:DUF2076 domain-containing protein [Buchnera aphidicola]|uniref:DUF2076 domain-containing protein n=1 Tax=Buchnera aphidicola TaxID=9 RepID=UPI003BEEEA9C
MQDKEKKLIENLFNRLKTTELNSSPRDEEADILIKNLVKNQPSSSYYMIQTILIQETAIQKMNAKIEELKDQILKIESKNNIKKPSFLSGFFSKKNSSSPVYPSNNNTWKNDAAPVPQNINSSIPYNNNSSSSSFLSNALQTATGVAGGMILGNMLMNLFQHTKPEEDIFNTIHDDSSLDHSNSNVKNNEIDDDIHDSDLINNEYDHSDFDTSDNDVFHSDSNNQYVDDIDMNDDNLI